MSYGHTLVESGDPAKDFVMILAASHLIAQREIPEHGTAWCESRLVGPLRRILGHSFPPNVLPLLPPESETIRLLLARDDCAAFLERHCRACGGCRLGR